MSDASIRDRLRVLVGAYDPDRRAAHPSIPPNDPAAGSIHNLAIQPRLAAASPSRWYRTLTQPSGQAATTASGVRHSVSWGGPWGASWAARATNLELDGVDRRVTVSWLAANYWEIEPWTELQEAPQLSYSLVVRSPSALQVRPKITRWTQDWNQAVVTYGDPVTLQANVPQVLTMAGIPGPQTGDEEWLLGVETVEYLPSGAILEATALMLTTTAEPVHWFAPGDPPATDPETGHQWEHVGTEDRAVRAVTAWDVTCDVVSIDIDRGVDTPIAGVHHARTGTATVVLDGPVQAPDGARLAVEARNQNQTGWVPMFRGHLDTMAEDWTKPRTPGRPFTVSTVLRATDGVEALRNQIRHGVSHTGTQTTQQRLNALRTSIPHILIYWISETSGTDYTPAHVPVVWETSIANHLDAVATSSRAGWRFTDWDTITMKSSRDEFIEIARFTDVEAGPERYCYTDIRLGRDQGQVPNTIRLTNHARTASAPFVEADTEHEWSPWPVTRPKPVHLHTHAADPETLAARLWTDPDTITTHPVQVTLNADRADQEWPMFLQPLFDVVTELDGTAWAQTVTGIRHRITAKTWRITYDLAVRTWIPEHQTPEPTTT